MATEIVATLRIDGLEQVNQTLGQVEQKIGNVQQAATNVGTNTGIPKLNTDTTNAVKTLDNFEKKLGNTINVSRSAQGAARVLGGSIELATSAFAAFGVENEDVAKTLLRVQAAASFSSGIRDLARGITALGGTFGVLNKIMLASPFVLIGTLVATLVSNFIGFDNILKVLSKTAEVVFAPLSAVFGLFSSGKEEIEDTTNELELYNAELEKTNQKSQQNIREKQRIVDLLRAENAGIVAIRQAELQLAIQQKISSGEREIDLVNRIALLNQELTTGDFNDKQREEKQKELVQREKELEETRADNFNAETQRQVILKQQQQDAIELAKKRAQDELQTIIDTEKLKVLRTSEGSLIRIEAQINEAEKVFETRKKLSNLLEINDIELLILEQEKINKVSELNQQLNQLKNSYQEVNKESKEVLAPTIDVGVNVKAIQDIIDRRQLLVDGLKLELEQLDLSAEGKISQFEMIYNAEIKLIEARQSLEVQLAEEKGEDIEEINLKYDKLRLDAQKKLSVELEKIDKQRLQEVLNATKNFVESIGNIVQDVSPFFESVGQTALETFEKIANQVPDLLKKLTDDTLSEQERLAAGIGFIGSSIGQITEIIQKDTEIRLEQIDKEEEERISSLERQKEAGLITEQELSVGKRQIQDEFIKKRREAEKKAFEQEKAIRIVQAIAQTAQAVLNSFSSGSAIGGPPVGAVFAGIAAAFGAAQIGIISAQKFPEQGGGGGSSSVPSVSTPSLAAEGSITPTTFNPQTFGTGVGQEQTFGNSNIVGETTSGVGGGGSQGGGLVLRAYVVESDIASTTNRLSSIREASEL